MEKLTDITNDTKLVMGQIPFDTCYGLLSREDLGRKSSKITSTREQMLNLHIIDCVPLTLKPYVKVLTNRSVARKSLIRWSLTTWIFNSYITSK